MCPNVSQAVALTPKSCDEIGPTSLNCFCRKALQVLDHIALTRPQQLPSKKLLPLVAKALFASSLEIREAALLLLTRMTREKDILEELKKVRPYLV